MNTIEKLFYTISAYLVSTTIYAQDEILERLKEAQSDTQSTFYDYVDTFFGYGNIFIGPIIAGWAFMTFRKSRAASEDDPESFSWVKFLAPKVTVLLVYVGLQVVSRAFLN